MFNILTGTGKVGRGLAKASSLRPAAKGMLIGKLATIIYLQTVRTERAGEGIGNLTIHIPGCYPDDFRTQEHFRSWQINPQG